LVMVAPVSGPGWKGIVVMPWWVQGIVFIRR